MTKAKAKAKAPSPLGSARAEYEALTGNAPSPKLKEPALAAKIAELKAGGHVAPKPAESETAPAAPADSTNLNEISPHANAKVAPPDPHLTENLAPPSDAVPLLHREGIGSSAVSSDAPHTAPTDPARPIGPAVPAQPAPEGTVYLKHPEGISATYRGVALKADGKGRILAPASAVEELGAHGFVAA